jgi:hypothetical protein
LLENPYRKKKKFANPYKATKRFVVSIPKKRFAVVNNPYAKRKSIVESHQLSDGGITDKMIEESLAELGESVKAAEAVKEEENLYGDITDDMLCTQHFNPPMITATRDSDFDWYGGISDDMLCTQDFNPRMPMIISRKTVSITNPYKKKKPYKIFRPPERDIVPPKLCKSAYANYCKEQREKSKKLEHRFQIIRTWNDVKRLKVNFNKGNKYWSYDIKDQLRGNIDIVEMLIDLHRSDYFHYGMHQARGIHISCLGAEADFKNCMELLQEVNRRNQDNVVNNNNKISEFLMRPALLSTDPLYEDYRRCMFAVAKRMRMFLEKYPIQMGEPKMRTVRTFSKYVERLKSKMRIASNVMPGTQMWLSDLGSSHYAVGSRTLDLRDKTISPIMRYFPAK